MKRVRLNCVYGDQKPGIVDLPADVADRLISQGYAELPGVDSTGLVARVAELEAENQMLKAEIEAAKGAGNGKGRNRS